LTTFRLIARDAFKAIATGLQVDSEHGMPILPEKASGGAILNPIAGELPGMTRLNAGLRRRLLGRYGADAPALVAAAMPGELAFIPGTPLSWAELRWAARAEGVVHLDDLLLRRVRLGLLLPEGGRALLPQICAICQPELGWDDERWTAEETAYLALWQQSYGLPPQEEIPDWQRLLEDGRRAKAARQAMTKARRKTWRNVTAGTLLSVLGTFLVLLLVHLRRDRPVVERAR
jgi:glycerol-3-phosphate dehydrogenase